jgi:hypothetical protein
VTVFVNRIAVRAVGYVWTFLLVLVSLSAATFAAVQFVGSGGRACVTDVGAPRLLCRDGAYTGRAVADVLGVQDYDGDPFTLDGGAVQQPDWVVDLSFTADGVPVRVSGLQWTASTAPVDGGTVLVAFDPQDPAGSVASAELLDAVRPELPDRPRRVSPELLVVAAGAAGLALVAFGATFTLARFVDMVNGRQPPR